MTSKRDHKICTQLLREPETREEGLRRLADSSIRNAASIATRYLRDPDEFVRSAALECLKKRGGRRYSEVVAQCLLDEAEIVRVTAIECLVAWGARSVRSRLVRLLDDRSPLVRAYSAWALGRLRARDAEKALTRRLANERRAIARAGLLEALVLLTRDRVYFDALLRLLTHQDHAVRCFAANSLLGVATSKTAREVGAALHGALEREGTVAGRETLQKNLALLSAE